MKKIFRYLLNLLGALSLTLAVFFLLACELGAQAYLHPARVPPSAAPLRENGVPYQDVQLTTQDGVTLSAWYTPPANGRVILLAHGLSGSRYALFHALFIRNGYGALSWDFRAHGASGGEFSTLGYAEQLDAEAALDFALTQPCVERVGAWGASLGGAVALLTAAKRAEIQAVVADSSFPALEDAMRVNTPFDFPDPFVVALYQLHSGIRVKDVSPEQAISLISPRATFIIDGWQGGAIRMNAPNRLYDAAKPPKEIWVEKGVPHLGMYRFRPELYEAKVIAFFDTYLSQP